MSIPKLITHACGIVDGVIYSNSKEALANSYFKWHSKYIEIDINQSRDNQYVLIHDWELTFKRLFGYDLDQIPTLEEFQHLTMQKKLTPMILDEFLDFMRIHQDLHLVSDVKPGCDNETFCHYLKTHYEDLIPRIYIQCYYEEEYVKIKNLGFKNLVYALYREPLIDFANLDNFIKQHKVKYIGINKTRIEPDFILSLKKNNIYILTHTVNTEAELQDLTKQGINSCFTDELYQSHL